jgi:hypothetical protein
MLALAVLFLSGVFAAIAPRRSGPLAIVVAIGASHFSSVEGALFALLGLLVLGHFLAALIADDSG